MLVVGIGEYIVSKDVGEQIITHALGSCVAFILRCPTTKKTAMAHVVLPEVDRTEQYQYLETKPGYFADIIVPQLLKDFLRDGFCRKEQLQIILVGGADSKNPNDIFKVGLRNVDKIKKFLKEYGIEPVKMEVGGSFSRTVEVNISDGSVTIRSQNMVI